MWEGDFKDKRLKNKISKYRVKEMVETRKTENKMQQILYSSLLIAIAATRNNKMKITRMS